MPSQGAYLLSRLYLIMLNIFVTNALSYICARQYWTDKNISYRNIFIISPNKRVTEQIVKIANSDYGNKIFIVYKKYQIFNIRVFGSLIHSVIARARLQYFLFCTKKTDEILLSTLDSPISLFIHKWFSKKHAKIISIDDGLSTVINYKLLARYGYISKDNHPHLSATCMKTMLQFLLFSHKPVLWKNIQFYSIFPLDKLSHSLDLYPVCFRKNCLKHMYIEKRQNDFSSSAFFIGQPHVLAGRISQHDYNAVLQKISLFYKKKNIELLYIPHPRESADQLEGSIKVHEVNEPMELYISSLSIMPYSISGFYSSCLYSISMMFANTLNVEFFLLDQVIMQAKKTSPAIFDLIYLMKASNSKISIINNL